MTETMIRDELLRLLEVMAHPKKYGHTQNAHDQTLINFCALCPDPVQARWLIVECLDPMTDEELVDRALSTVSRPLSDVPTSIIPVNHPARNRC